MSVFPTKSKTSAIKALTRQWIVKAEEDFTAAFRLHRIRGLAPYDHVCFHAQECLDKYLKAMLSEANVPFVKTDPLPNVVQASVRIDPTLAWLRDYVDRFPTDPLDYLYPGRSVNKREAYDVFSCCQRVRSAIRYRLGVSARLPNKRQRGSLLESTTKESEKCG